MEVEDYMVYVPQLDKFYEEMLISSFEYRKKRIELKEIRGNYFLIEFENNEVVKVSDFKDLSIVLSVYNSLLETLMGGNLH